jgi:hypothetical protein
MTHNILKYLEHRGMEYALRAGTWRWAATALCCVILVSTWYWFVLLPLRTHLVPTTISAPEQAHGPLCSAALEQKIAHLTAIKNRFYAAAHKNQEISSDLIQILERHGLKLISYKPEQISDCSTDSWYRIVKATLSCQGSYDTLCAFLTELRTTFMALRCQVQTLTAQDNQVQATFDLQTLFFCEVKKS